MGGSRIFGCHHPRKRMTQYAAAPRSIAGGPGMLGRPVQPGDDNRVLGRAA